MSARITLSTASVLAVFALSFFGCSPAQKTDQKTEPKQNFSNSSTEGGEAVEIRAPGTETTSQSVQPETTAEGKAQQSPVQNKAETSKVVHLNTKDVGGDLMVYSGRSKSIMDPIFERFEKKTGIKVSVVYNKKTIALAERIAQEGTKTEADVFLGQDPGYIGALAKKGHLIKLPQPLLDLVVPDHRDPEGFWIGTSGRARVLVYNPDRVKAQDLPSSLDGLADAKWSGRVGWAPSNASLQAHVSTLRKIWGEGKTKAWLQRMITIKPQVYPKNSPQVKGVANGEIDIGWVNHYYLHRAKATNPNLQARNYFFRDVGGVGNLVMLSGVGITKHSQRKGKALKLVEFLLSPDAQNHFAQKVFEYPTISGIALHPDVPPIPSGALAGDKAALADVQGTVRLLRELNLL